MASRYPAAIDSQSLQHADFKLFDGVNAIETTLGLTPQGASPDVASRLNGGQDAVVTTAASGSAATLNLGNGVVQDITLTANCTITLSGSSAGVACTMQIIIRQDGTGNRTITWPGSVKWPAGTAPTLSTGANAVDLVTLVTVNNGTTWYATLVGKGYA